MSDHEEHDDFAPGMYEFNPGTLAAVDQQRAELVDLLRTTKGASITALEADGGTVHWALWAGDERDGPAFLAHAAARAVRDFATAAGVSYESACLAILEALGGR